MIETKFGSAISTQNDTFCVTWKGALISLHWLLLVHVLYASSSSPPLVEIMQNYLYPLAILIKPRLQMLKKSL